jgi:hypothetical protein
MASAQESAAPLSAIDWLSRHSPDLQSSFPPTAEPPIADSGLVPDITVTELDGDARRRLGLLPYSVTGLAPELWTRSDAARLERLLGSALDQQIPAAQELLLSLLLADADDLPDPDAATRWLIARVDALIELGAVEPALTLVEQADPTRDKALFARWMTLALLARNETGPCSVLARDPTLRPDEATRIFCTAKSGDFDTAALLYGTAAALDVFSETEERLLARYLDPELFADEPMPRAPVRPDALTFRLFEAAGEPLPTAPLPRAFAHTSLSEDAGWKAQLEAAERLARAGVLPSNKLLGLYSDRKPAASGGIWDRVAAFQAFEAALESGSADQVSEALPPMWRGIQAGGLEVAFSELFADRLTELSLTGPAADIAFRMQLLSRRYESAAAPNTADTAARFLASVAAGQPDPALAGTDAEQAVADALSDTAIPSEEAAYVTAGTLGETLLLTLEHLSDGGRGDLSALAQSLTDLRAMGLEDMARRSALQYLILEDAG